MTHAHWGPESSVRLSSAGQKAETSSIFRSALDDLIDDLNNHSGPNYACVAEKPLDDF